MKFQDCFNVFDGDDRHKNHKINRASMDMMFYYSKKTTAIDLGDFNADGGGVTPVESQ